MHNVTVRAGGIAARATLYAEVHVGRGHDPTTWDGVLCDVPDQVIVAALTAGVAQLMFPAHDDEVSLSKTIRDMHRDGTDLYFTGEGLPPDVLW